MSDPRHEVRRLLPLRPQWLHILLSLAERPLHGYAIMTEVTERTGGSVRLWPATLYNTLKQLLDEGLIAEAADAEGDSGGPPRKTYRLTELGGEVLEAEARRMESLVDAVRAVRAQRP